MKKLLFTFFVLLFASPPSPGQIRVGPFLGYGEGLNRWGIGAYAEVVLNESVSISPIFTQYFPKSFEDNPRRSGWELNGNLNYYVVNGDMWYLYGLAGLNYTNIRTRTKSPLLDEIDRDGNVGFNFGIGTMVAVSDYLYPFAEGKYTAGGFSQVSLILGVKFQPGGRSVTYDY